MAEPQRATDTDADADTIRLVANDLGRSEGRKELLAPQNLEWTALTVVAVTGSNGSGKSTLLRTLAGLAPSSTGAVTVNGSPPTDRHVMADTAFVPDAPVTFLDMSVDDQCAYVARLHGLTEPPRWIDDLRDILGFGPDLSRRLPIAFSKGERQKASILLHLSRPHRLVILDEPSTGLDAEARAGLAAWLADHAHHHPALVVVASHDDELIDVADLVHHLDDAPADDVDGDDG